jgi:hypothetical protein
MALHGPHISPNSKFSLGSEYYRWAQTVTEAVSKTVVNEASQNLPGIKLNSKMMSPWGLHSLYQASITYLRMDREASTLDSVDALKTLRETLRALDARWKAAGL